MPYFRVLGIVDVIGSTGTSAKLPAALQAALATLLLHNGRQVRCDLLISSLWDAPPSSANANLRTHIARLRKHLEELEPGLSQRLVTTFRGTQSYKLCIEQDELDLLIFTDEVERARAQASHGYLAAAADGFQRSLNLWTSTRQLRSIGSQYLRRHFSALDELRLSVVEELIELRLKMIPAKNLLAQVRALTVEHPLRERFHSLLIKTLYRAGDTTGALLAYEGARALFAEELGHSPGPELQKLRQAILRHDARVFDEL